MFSNIFACRRDITHMTYVYHVSNLSSTRGGTLLSLGSYFANRTDRLRAFQDTRSEDKKKAYRLNFLKAEMADICAWSGNCVCNCTTTNGSKIHISEKNRSSKSCYNYSLRLEITRSETVALKRSTVWEI